MDSVKNFKSRLYHTTLALCPHNGWVNTEHNLFFSSFSVNENVCHYITHLFRNSSFVPLVRNVQSCNHCQHEELLSPKNVFIILTNSLTYQPTLKLYCYIIRAVFTWDYMKMHFPSNFPSWDQKLRGESSFDRYYILNKDKLEKWYLYSKPWKVLVCCRA